MSAACASLLAASLCGKTAAEDFSSAVFFGDSLSDAGTYVGEPPLAGIFPIQGKFTTNPGPVWSELVTEAFGFDAAPANQGGLIYAAGGVRVNSRPAYPNNALVPFIQTASTIAEQVDNYLAANGGKADANGLYAFWGGANDLFALLENDASYNAQPMADVAAELTSVIGTLKSAGARYVLVANLPDTGSTPGAADDGNEAESTAAAQAFNSALFSSLANQGIQVIPIDTYSMLKEIIANPADFGITNTTDKACSVPTSLVCGEDNYVAGTEQTYVFADGDHPTTKIHAILSEYVLSVLAAPQQIGLMADSAVNQRAQLQRLQRTQFDAQYPNPHNDNSRRVWLLGSGGEFERDGGYNDPSLEDDHYNLNTGIQWQLSDQWQLGTAFNYSRNNADYSGDRGGFKQRETAISLLAKWQNAEWYGYGSLTYGYINTDLQRDIHLASALYSASADVEGRNTSAYVEGGYQLRSGAFIHGPLLALHSQYLRLDSFEESGAGPLNLGYQTQTRHSNVASAGWQAQYRISRLNTYARVMLDHDFEDEQHDVTVRTLSISEALPYSLPVSSADSSGVSAQVGVTGELTEKVNFNAGALKDFAQDDADNWQLYGGVTLSF